MNYEEVEALLFRFCYCVEFGYGSFNIEDYIEFQINF